MCPVSRDQDGTGAVDYTYRRPARRQSVFPDVVQPTLRAPLPRIAVVVDTSGSMSDKMLSQALGEIKGMLQATGLNGVTVLPCDAQVHSVQTVFAAHQVRLQGGGGTDMGAGLARAAPYGTGRVGYSCQQCGWSTARPPT